jgi:hypothetical protein
MQSRKAKQQLPKCFGSFGQGVAGIASEEAGMGTDSCAMTSLGAPLKNQTGEFFFNDVPERMRRLEQKRLTPLDAAGDYLNTIPLAYAWPAALLKGGIGAVIVANRHQPWPGRGLGRLLACIA